MPTNYGHAAMQNTRGNHIHWALSHGRKKNREKKKDASSSSPHAKSNTEPLPVLQTFFFLISSDGAHPNCSRSLPGSMTSHNLPGRLMQPGNQKQFSASCLIATNRAFLN